MVCAGPDTFQALKKAQELERAYREKYDPSGVSIERLSEMKPLDAIRARMGGGLFAQKSFLRATGLVASWKKTDWPQAIEVFARDVDGTIVVTLEEDLSPEHEAMITAWPKAKIYRHTALSGTAFFTWAEAIAKTQGIAWDADLRQFASSIEGDGWSFWNALPRWKATGTFPEAVIEATSPFARAEQYLKEESRERAFIGVEDELSGLLVQQARQALRIVAGAPDPRMPAFAQRKWQRLSPAQQARLKVRFAQAAKGLTRQRQGLLKEGEEILGF